MSTHKADPSNDETQISDATHISDTTHQSRFNNNDDTMNSHHSAFPSLPERSRSEGKSESQHTGDLSDDSTVLGSIHGAGVDDPVSEETVLSTSMPNVGNDPISEETVLSTSMPNIGNDPISEETVLSTSMPNVGNDSFARPAEQPSDASLDGPTANSHVSTPATTAATAPTTTAATATSTANPATPASTTANTAQNGYQAPAGNTNPQVSPKPADASVDSLSAPYASASPVSGIIQPPKDSILDFKRSFDALVDNIGKVVVGKSEPIKLCVTALMVGGHVLLEDNPGTGKTQLARGLANSIATSFKRIQFTPDLLPSDVVGVTFYDQKSSEFEFRQGPIFASIVLADEINRASPKTQSALLEVMEEQKTTVDGKTYQMPQPFIVIATQNPLEQLGTYKLPEAQMDRFLIKTSVGAPGHDVSIRILKDIDITDRADTVSAVLSGDDIVRLRKTAKDVRVDERILEYIERLIEATRLSEKLRVGSSMRGALALTRCARIWAAADARDYVLPDDVQDLAVPVLAHRIILNAETAFKGETAEQVVAEIVDSVPAPAMGA